MPVINSNSTTNEPWHDVYLKGLLFCLDTLLTCQEELQCDQHDNEHKADLVQGTRAV